MRSQIAICKFTHNYQKRDINLKEKILQDIRISIIIEKLQGGNEVSLFFKEYK